MDLNFNQLSKFFASIKPVSNDTKFNNLYLLVIECELSDEKMPEGEEFFKNLFNILQQHSHIKLILVGREGNLSDFINEEAKIRFVGTLFFELYDKKTLEVNFDDLTYAAQDKLLEREVIFQGEEIALDKLITRQNDKVREVIDSEILIALIKNEKIELGKPVPTLGEIEDYYIDRKFYHQVKLKENVLSDLDDKFFIVNISGKNDLSVFAEREKIKYCSNLKRDPDQNSPDEKIKFILLDGTQSAADNFKYLCERYSKQTIHWLRKETNGDLVWLQSQGSVSRLRKYLDRSTDGCLIKDKDIIEHSVDKQLIIIAAEPGIGKSTVLTYLANQEKEKDVSKWLIRVDLKNCKEKFNQNLSDITDGIISFLYDINRTTNGLSKTLLKYFITNKGKIVLLLDGFDEIEKNQQDNVIELIKDIKKTKIEKVIVSTRLHEKETLENEFLVFTYSFRKFNSTDQKKFLERFWKRNLDINIGDVEKEVLLNRYIDELLKSFYKSNAINNAAKGFMGIPLQTKMIAEIYQSAIQRSLDINDEHFNAIKDLGLLELYGDFVQIKYDLYFNEKRGMNISPDPIEKNELTSSVTKIHSRLAMRLLFPGVSEDLQVLLGNKLLQAHGRIEKLNSIGIFQIIGNKIDITHRSYAEYFASAFLSNKLQKGRHSEKYNHALSFLSKEIFKPENEVIRIFLDSFLTSKTTRYEECLDEIKRKLDILHDIPSKALVSSLHDAIAKEERFTGLNKLIKNLLSELEVGQPKIKEIEGFLLKIKHCIDQLSEAASLNRRLRYAVNEADLITVGKLLENSIINVDDTDNMGRTALHYAAQKGDKKIVLALLGKGFKVEALDGCGRNTIHYAARYNDQDIKAETIVCLLEHANENNDDDKYKVIINQEDYQGPKDPKDPKKNPGFKPIYYAFKQGFWHLVSALIQKGADYAGMINARELLFHYIFEDKPETIEIRLSNVNVNDINQYCDHQQNGLLHIAAQRGSLGFVNALLKKGIDVQARNKHGERPIHIAAKNVHWEVVTRLLSNDKSNRADFNDLDGIQKNSLLEYSKKNKSLDWLRLFFQDGNKSNHFNAFNLSEQEKIDLLCQFICSGDLDIAAFFIDKGTEIDIPDSKGKKPIQYAAECAHWSIVERLLIKQAALFDDLYNLNEEYVESLFNYSVDHTRLNMVRIFIENAHGQNYFNKLTDQQRRNCLNRLIFVGASELAAKKAFIDTLIETEVDINSQDGDGKTLLHQAAEYQQLAIVSYLVEDKQADIHTKDDEGHTPLYYAAVNTQDGNVEVVKYLLEKEMQSYELDLISQWGDEKAANYEPLNKLHYVAIQGYKEVLEVLLTEEGADVDVMHKYSGETPLLHCVVSHGHLEMVEYLVEQGSDVDVKGGIWGEAPLHLAAKHGHENIAKLLIEKGAAVDAKDNYTSTPLHQAALAGHLEMVEYLVEQGSDVDVKGGIWGEAPLHLAARHGHENIAKLLIEKGAAVDAKDNYANTPLHQAALASHLGMVTYLVEQGADPKSKNMDGQTPLHRAIFELAIENGFNNTSKNKSKVAVCRQIITLLRLAVENSHDDNSNNEFARTSSNPGIIEQFIFSFFTAQRSDDEPQNQSHSAQQPHYSGGGN